MSEFEEGKIILCYTWLSSLLPRELSNFYRLSLGFESLSPQFPPIVSPLYIILLCLRSGDSDLNELVFNGENFYGDLLFEALLYGSLARYYW